MASTSKAKMKVGEYTVDLANHIGSGAVGMVHPATDARGNKVAAKRICKREEDIITRITRDLYKLLDLDHANIAKFENFHQLDSTVWIFMEFCPHKDLYEFFRKRRLTERQYLDIMIQIAQGVEYLHSNNIIHRDIKPTNVLIKNDNPIVAKVTDFDFSKFLEEDCDTSLMSTNVGTPAFKAPEFFLRNELRKIEYHRNVDIFALGLTYLAIVQEDKALVPRIETPNDDSELHAPIGRLIAERIKYGRTPLDVIPRGNRKNSLWTKFFKGKGTASSTAATNEPVTVMSDQTKQIRKLILKMTPHLPEERISASEIIRELRLIEEQVLVSNLLCQKCYHSYVLKQSSASAEFKR